MASTRRQFLGASLAGGVVASGLVACASAGKGGEHGKARESLSILILGGTGFLGPAVIDAALARGHRVTLFNSGRTEGRRAEGGRPSVVPEGVATLVGNRDPKLTADDRRLAGDPELESKRDPDSPRGLTQLEGKRFDAVVDTSGYFPRMVKASAELLAPNVGQYVFISTISVYARNDIPHMDESGELATLADPTTEEFGASFENYGGAKVLCEQAAEAAMPGRTTVVRPGYIVGPLDPTRRWIWWPWRTAQGGEMLVPGERSDPIQIIDVRDLAEFLVRAMETRTTGVFNATGPAEPLSMEAMLAGCRAASDATTTCTWAEPAFLAEQGLEFPIWAPPSGESAGFHQIDVSKAVRAGLRFRSVESTARDTLAWHASLPAELQERVLPPISLAKEAEALAAWKARA